MAKKTEILRTIRTGAILSVMVLGFKILGVSDVVTGAAVLGGFAMHLDLH